ncbi:DNA repair protein RecN [Celerinatantimonas diazotrophica]|uniref:DNA repair protein RecN n=1 Tax=Celerinatantimonas diazotrophica TaxID=412034 RepID=A0A4R1K4N9_9GAMM|nr:DNA repair protein RecN [Celerinatantimonas diazotrophica]TCK58900.1 DNA replication and repair protein RecN [Celerinatantimonas diazotrophica]CAG9297532.1 DNA repair protein RecN [Celerinatantimonas diazotrophica]
MLTQLTVQNFAIVRFLELDLSSGMTTITGETGAGKSIAIDALGLCLGDRAEAAMVRPREKRAEVSARFDIHQNLAAQTWLLDNQLDSSGECILRRVVTHEGRSKAYINATPVPVSQLKHLGAKLVAIHGQHAHHQLLKPTEQLRIIDSYSRHQNQLEQVAQAFQQWQSLRHEKDRLLTQQASQQSRQQLLEYQVQELDEFALQPEEYQQLDQQHKRLSNSSELLDGCQQLAMLFSQDDEVNVLAMLSQGSKKLSELLEYEPTLQSAYDLIQEAIIQVEEASHQLSHSADQFDVDPEEFAQLEQRLSTSLDLARKHQVSPEQLPDLHLKLAEELAQMASMDELLKQIDEQITTSWQSYQSVAARLSQSRQRQAKQLSHLLEKSIRQLSMPKAKCQLEIISDPEHPSPNGWDKAELLVTTNPGQPLQPLNKVVSGGELSRISLAIQVICAENIQVPTLIFDEIDVGISGPTAAIVGQMLRLLGQTNQVLCVTHLPQVAGNGHQQLRVSKKQQKQSTETTMDVLNGDQRVEELARLLAGDEITEVTLANARELLK